MISVKMEKIDAKINNLIKKCDSLGANATKAGKGTDKLSDACTKPKDRAEAGSAGTQKLSGSLKAPESGRGRRRDHSRHEGCKTADGRLRGNPGGASRAGKHPCSPGEGRIAGKSLVAGIHKGWPNPPGRRLHGL